MSIESRGPNKNMVLSSYGVPVADVADAIVDGRTLEWICKRFPITKSEVFESIDALADMIDNWNNNIELRNVGDQTNIDLETASVSDTVYFNLINQGRLALPQEDRFSYLYSEGLRNVINEIYTDLKNNTNHFENSELHTAVHKAVKKAIGDADPTQVLYCLNKGEDNGV